MSWIEWFVLLIVLAVAGLLAAGAVLAWKTASAEKQERQRQHETIASLDTAATNAVNGIPKIIHQIWIGDKAAPPKQWLDTWSVNFMQQNPGYTYVLWRDEDLENLQMRNRALYDAEKTLPGKADIARYEILHRYGGVYVDADIVWLGKNNDDDDSGSSSVANERDAVGAFDRLLNRVDAKSQIFVACEPHNPQNIDQWKAIGVQQQQQSNNEYEKDDCLLFANSIIGASPQNRHVLSIIEHIASTYAQRSAEHPEQPWLTTGPFPMTEALESSDATVFDSGVFYPADWHDDHSAKTVKQLRERYPDAYAFHYGYSTTPASP